MANTISTGAALVALILALGPISGAHFNPAVSLVDAWQQGVATSANPAVTVARAFTDTFAGIRLVDAPMFISCRQRGSCHTRPAQLSASRGKPHEVRRPNQ
jgi:glycerol uptake facilitator-like aquaporin